MFANLFKSLMVNAFGTYIEVIIAINTTIGLYDG